MEWQAITLSIPLKVLLGKRKIINIFVKKNGRYYYEENKSLEKTLQEKTGENIIKRDIEAINILSNSQDKDAKKAIVTFEKDMKVAELMANGKITKIPKTEGLEEAMYYVNKYKKQKEKQNGSKEN